MQITPDLVHRVFLSTVAFYLLAECWITVRQILSAERFANQIPEGFDQKLSLAAHKKAAACTTEEAQTNLIVAFCRAAVAFLLTSCGGFTVLAAAAETLTTSELLAGWLILCTTAFLLLAIELPFAWFARFRLRERFGLTKSSRKQWLTRALTEGLSGWLVAIPLSAIALIFFAQTGDAWWWALWGLWLVLLFWRWRASLARDRAWSRKSEPVRDLEMRQMVETLLDKYGLVLDDLVIMARPPLWKYAHALLVGTGKRRRVILFVHAAVKLNREEMLAIVAIPLGRTVMHHSPLRVLFSAVAGFGVAWLLGVASRTPIILEGLGFPATLLPATSGSSAAFVLALAIVVLPFLLFPMRPFISLGSRGLQYAADRFAARAVGHETLMRALVRLQRDYATTLTPSRIYSLFHFERAPVFMRLRHIRADAVHHPVTPVQTTDSAAPFPRTVFAQETRLRRLAKADKRTAYEKALEAAAELNRALLKHHPLVIDDGFEDDDEPSETSKNISQPTPPALKTSDEEKHEKREVSQDER